MPRGVDGVSIHAFRGEGDQHDQRHAVYEQLFQSTPSGGKATSDQIAIDRYHAVSIHAFRGEGDLSLEEYVRRREVSIHAFRGEGD